MEKDESILVELRQRYGDRDWFYDAGYDQYGRPVVYVKYENHETNYEIPDRIAGKQLLVHFAASVKSNKEDFFVKSGNGTSSLPLYQKAITEVNIAFGKGIEQERLNYKTVEATVVKEPEMVDTEEQERELELSVRVLTDELDRLEKLCGSNILGEIFFEEHDRENAVTNLSSKFPEVRKHIHRLYELYGFDTIYEELEL